MISLPTRRKPKLRRVVCVSIISSRQDRWRTVALTVPVQAGARGGSLARALVRLAIVLIVAAAACDVSQDGQVPTPLPLVARPSYAQDGSRVVELSHTPSEAAAGQVRAETLTVDLRLGGVERGFGHLADVTVLRSGQIAVLDRSECVVWLFDSTGVAIGKWSREGAGPGEFRIPVALAAFGDHVVVFEPIHTRPFTILDTSGRPFSTAPPGVLGDSDLGMIARRGTLQMLDWPYQMSSEDWTRRLGPYDDSTFVYQSQPDERMAVMRGEAYPLDKPPVSLMRFSARGRFIDTLATAVAPPSRRIAGPVNAEPQFDQPIFARRPLWATGDGWFAQGHGKRNEIVVVWRDGARVVLTWPLRARIITVDDKTAAALWLKEVGMRDLPTGDAVRAEWNAATPAEREDWLQFHREYWQFPDTAPEVTAMYGAGKCLWLAGLSPGDYPDGTALTWIGVNLATEQIERVVVIPRRGSRVRHFGRAAVFASYRDEMSVDYLERFPLRNVQC